MRGFLNLFAHELDNEPLLTNSLDGPLTHLASLADGPADAGLQSLGVLPVQQPGGSSASAVVAGQLAEQSDQVGYVADNGADSVGISPQKHVGAAEGGIPNGIDASFIVPNLEVPKFVSNGNDAGTKAPLQTAADFELFNAFNDGKAPAKSGAEGSIGGNTPEDAGQATPGLNGAIDVATRGLATAGGPDGAIGEEFSSGLVFEDLFWLTGHFDDIVEAGDESPLVQQSSSVISLNSFRADPSFAGINGAGTSIVIIDTGADLDHPAFGPDADFNGIADRIVFQYDFSGTNDGNASDTNGHGTNVAGIAASSNGTYTGMAPGANIIVLKVFPDGPNPSATGTDINEALSWVVANRATYNIVSVNMSLGSGNTNVSAPSFWSANLSSLAAAGVAVVAAAGNDFYGFGSQQGVSTLAADPNAWAVSATFDANVGGVSWSGGAIDYSTAADRVVSFSQRSASLTDIMAPGSMITNAYLDGGYASYSGTSMAAPHIAGIVALAQDYAESISGGQHVPVATLLSFMRSSADWINDGDDENDNVVNTGANFPRIDVHALMQSVRGYFSVDPGPPGPWLNLPDVYPNHFDADADNDSDILWMSSAGRLMLTEINVRQSQAATYFGQIGNDWRVTGLGDFDRDVDTDIFWRRSDGLMLIHEVNARQIVSGAIVGHVGADWKHVGTGDFDRDADSDLLFHRADGLVLIEEIEARQIRSGAIVGTVGTEWKVLAAGDFDRDKDSDIVWRRNDGALLITEVDGRQIRSASVLGILGPDWEFSGTGDFDRDGDQDLLWRHSNGNLLIHRVEGRTIQSGAVVGSLGQDWQVAGTRDFDRDGDADLLFHRANGDALILEIEWAQVASGGIFAHHTEWQIIGKQYDFV